MRHSYSCNYLISSAAHEIMQIRAFTDRQHGGKCDLSDFDCGMIVGARRIGLSVSVTADLPGFSHTTISRVLLRMVQ